MTDDRLWYELNQASKEREVQKEALRERYHEATPDDLASLTDSVANQAKLLGQHAVLLHRESNFAPRVIICDTKNAYGRHTCQIKPVSGSGRMWVRTDRLMLVGPNDDPNDDQDNQEDEQP